MGKVSRLLCIAGLAACGATLWSQTTAVTQNPHEIKRDPPITTIDQLQHTVEIIQSLSILSIEEKTFSIDRAREEYKLNRQRTTDQITDNLNRALDAWYANDRDWRKIPDEIWSHLSERNRGRLKLGIDPEMQCVAAAPVKTAGQPPKSKK